MPSDLEKEFSIVASSFEDIDLSLYNFVIEQINICAFENDTMTNIIICEQIIRGIALASHERCTVSLRTGKLTT